MSYVRAYFKLFCLLALMFLVSYAVASMFSSTADPNASFDKENYEYYIFTLDSIETQSSEYTSPPVSKCVAFNKDKYDIPEVYTMYLNDNVDLNNQPLISIETENCNEFEQKDIITYK